MHGSGNTVRHRPYSLLTGALFVHCVRTTWALHVHYVKCSKPNQNGNPPKPINHLCTTGQAARRTMKYSVIKMHTWPSIIFLLGFASGVGINPCIRQRPTNPAQGHAKGVVCYQVGK